MNGNGDRCIDRVSAEYIRVGAEAASKRRFFFVCMTSRQGERISRDEHQRAYSTYFLPLFERNQQCMMFARSPDDVTRYATDVCVIPQKDRWEIPFEPRYREGLPMWSYRSRVVDFFTLMLRIDRPDDDPLFDQLLRDCWDPGILINPGGFYTPGVYPYARKTTTRTKKLWLSYRPDDLDMTIGIFASRETAADIYERALRLAKAYNVWGSLYELGDPLGDSSEVAGFRYTGRLPPKKIVDRHANWVYALDEEGEPGQDETTIRPDNNQEFISDLTNYAGADAIAADGTTTTALLRCDMGVALGVDVVYVYRGRRVIEFEIDGENRWSLTKGRSAGSLPLRIVSRLPCGTKDGPRIEVVLEPDGRAKLTGTQAD